MAEDKKGVVRVPQDGGTEQKGIVQDVVVPIVQSGVAGATGAYVANKLGRPKDPKK